MQLRRRKRPKLTAIPGKRIDRAISLMVHAESKTLAKETEEIMDEHILVELPEPNDRFRALDWVREEDRPLPKPCRIPLSHEQRIKLLAWRYENKMRLFHPAEKV